MIDKIAILDGGMGTMLQAAGMPAGERPEIYGMEHSETVQEIHEKYIAAGSDIIYADTFGANAHNLQGQKYTVSQVVAANVRTAKEAAKGRAKVALDIGPTGMLLEPLGTLDFEDAYDMFAEIVDAGKAAGADMAVIETMSDLQEARAALLAVKEHSDLPVWVTMSFEQNGRTFTGTTIASMALTLEGLGADAIGINCSLGPDEIYPLACELAEWTNLPIIIKPNAGLPDPATGLYHVDACLFAEQIKKYLGIPQIAALGGCCGTTPDYIEELKKMTSGAGVYKADNSFEHKKRNGVCGAGKVAEFGGIRVIGERINPTGKKMLQQALKDQDMNYIMKQAVDQEDAGADILDINVGVPGINEAEMMVKVVKAVQSVSSIPLQIDSSDPEAIEAGLRICCGKAIVNSVNGEDEKLKSILPIVKKYGASVIGLTLDEDGIPHTAQKRFDIAQKILDAAEKQGLSGSDVIIDCLTLTVSAQQEQAMETLNAVSLIREKLGLNETLGVSNVSFGLPERNRITAAFLAAALSRGVNMPIINPNTREIMDVITSFRVITGEDTGCGRYIEYFTSEKKDTVQPVSGSANNPQPAPAGNKAAKYINEAILKGLKEETREITAGLLETMTEMEVIETKLIPALDIVGEQYEKQIIFLPQLINAANAACAGFELIRNKMSEKGSSNSKGKILLATVQGDIHDIGKNIVRVVLENYGYRIIDLGKDVPPETIVEKAISEDIKLIGLSALMTTTVASMKKTIEALRDSGHKCSIMVGGAVLTPEYAAEIGADHYAGDAKAAADIAKEVLG